MWRKVGVRELHHRGRMERIGEWDSGFMQQAFGEDLRYRNPRVRCSEEPIFQMRRQRLD